MPAPERIHTKSRPRASVARRILGREVLQKRYIHDGRQDVTAGSNFGFPSVSFCFLSSLIASWLCTCIQQVNLQCLLSYLVAYFSSQKSINKAGCLRRTLF